MKNYLGDPSSPIKYTPDGDPIWLRMCLRLVMTCNQISLDFWELANCGIRSQSFCANCFEFVFAFFDNNIIRSCFFATETCAQTRRKTPETRRKTRNKNSNHDFCPEITLRGVAKQQKSVGNCKTLHLIEVQNKLLKILKVTIS